MPKLLIINLNLVYNIIYNTKSNLILCNILWIFVSLHGFFIVPILIINNKIDTVYKAFKKYIFNKLTIFIYFTGLDIFHEKF